MGKNKNDKKSPAAKKAAPETAEANNADMLTRGTDKSGTGKKHDDSKMKSKNR